MNKLFAPFAVCCFMIMNIAHADDQKTDNSLTFNVAALSDYRARGISQTRFDSALQAGADFVNIPTGIYAGTWLSTIKWVEDQGGTDNIEWDFYAGKRGHIITNLSYDVGVMVYTYPRNDLRTNANSTEIYGQLGYGPTYAKYSYSVGNLFGFANSRGSGYLDVGANIKAAFGTTLNLHAGQQTIANSSSANYVDWKIGISKNFGFATGALAVIGANTNYYVGPAPDFVILTKTELIVTFSKVF